MNFPPALEREGEKRKEKKRKEKKRKEKKRKEKKRKKKIFESKHHRLCVKECTVRKYRKLLVVNED